MTRTRGDSFYKRGGNNFRVEQRTTDGTLPSLRVHARREYARRIRAFGSDTAKMKVRSRLHTGRSLNRPFRDEKLYNRSFEQREKEKRDEKEVEESSSCPLRTSSLPFRARQDDRSPVCPRGFSTSGDDRRSPSSDSETGGGRGGRETQDRESADQNCKTKIEERNEAESRASFWRQAHALLSQFP